MSRFTGNFSDTEIDVMLVSLRQHRDIAYDALSKTKSDLERTELECWIRTLDSLLIELPAGFIPSALPPTNFC